MSIKFNPQGWLLVVVIILTLACGSGPATQPKEEAAKPTEGVATTAPLAATEPAPAAEQPTSPPDPPATEAAPTESTTEAPTGPINLPEETQRSYTALVFLQGATVMLEDTATRVQSGELKGMETFGRVLGVGIILKALDEGMAKPSPDPALQSAWEQGRTVVGAMRDILKRWTNKEIDAAGVTSELTPIKTQMAQTLSTADAVMAEQYGASPEKLAQIREEAMAKMQESMAKAEASDGSGATVSESSIEVAILSSSDYVDSIDYHHIVGEVQNNSDQPAGFVKVVATFYDNAGNVVGTEFSFTQLEVLVPGQKAPFDITSQKNPQATKYELQVQANPASVPTSQLKIMSANDRVDEIGYWHIAGEVANEGSAQSEFTKIVVTVYDNQGKVVGTGFTFSSLDKIPPAGKSPFEISLEKRENFDKYELQVEGK